MSERFAFRQIYYKDIQIFLTDGELRSKNHQKPQACHQTSYQGIVDRRGSAEFQMPCGGVVNDYVPFYFSPYTAFTYAIHIGNVSLRSPAGQNLGIANGDNRVFVVCRISDFLNSGTQYYFSDLALNSLAPIPFLENNLQKLENHVPWSLFDEAPLAASIPEIGYAGVCRYFNDRATPVAHQNRRRQRMAEFLVRDAVPLELVTCFVAKTQAIGDDIQQMVDDSDWDIPVLIKPGCYF